MGYLQTGPFLDHLAVIIKVFTFFLSWFIWVYLGLSGSVWVYLGLLILPQNTVEHSILQVGSDGLVGYLRVVVGIEHITVLIIDR